MNNKRVQRLGRESGLKVPASRERKRRRIGSSENGLFAERGGAPQHIRSDNGPEFIAEALKKWLCACGVGTLYIEPGAPWSNAYSETFVSRLRDELLNREVFSPM